MKNLVRFYTVCFLCLMITESSAYKYLFIIVPIVVTLAIPITILGIVIYNALYQKPAGIKLVIDHDAGADDALAIFMALLAEKCLDGPQVVAMTTTHGNVNEDQAYINSQRFLNVAKRMDVPIFRGANFSIVKDMPSDHYFGLDGLGDMEHFEYQEIKAENLHAAVALIELSIKYKDELVIVAIGAASNIALAARLDPKFLGRIKQLYLGSGHLYSEKYPEPEFNADQDVEGYLMTVRDANPDKVTLLPFSQAMTNVTQEWRDNVLGAIDTDIMRALNDYEQVARNNNKIGLWNLLDPIVMAVFLEPKIVVETKYTDNGILLCGDKRGINTNNFVSKDEANVKLIYSINEDIYKKYMYKVFSEC